MPTIVDGTSPEGRRIRATMFRFRAHDNEKTRVSSASHDTSNSEDPISPSIPLLQTTKYQEVHVN